MARKHFTAEQIIDKHREAEVEIAKGMKIGQVCKNWESSSRLITSGDENTAACESIRPSD